MTLMPYGSIRRNCWFPVYPFFVISFCSHCDKFIVAGGSCVIVSFIASCHAKGDRSTSRIQMSHSASTNLLWQKSQNSNEICWSLLLLWHPPAVHCCHRKQSTMACWRSSCDLGSHTDNLPKSECQNNSIDIRWQSHPKVEDAGNRWEKLFTILVSCCVPRFVGMSLDELFIFLNSAPLFVPAWKACSLFICSLPLEWISMNLGGFFSNIWS